MSNDPSQNKYLESHEWISAVDNGVASIGISDYAQESLGDITFVELPPVGASFNKGDTFGVVESVKAASDLYMPVTGEIVEINESLENEPQQINEDAYHSGWILKVKINDPSELESLMDYTAYQAHTGAAS